jgi:hypothetical protein
MIQGKLKGQNQTPRPTYHYLNRTQNLETGVTRFLRIDGRMLLGLI